MDFIERINFINNELKSNKTMREIRISLGISEKKLQKEIKENGFKFNQKLKQYITTTNVVVVKEEPTELITNEYRDKELYTLNYLIDNIDILKTIIEKYSTTNPTTNSTTDIVINLIDDKHLNPTPKSIRINQFVYNDWTEFCNKNKYYSKQDLISMALKEYMNNHNQ